LTTFMVSGPCPECHGSRLNARSSAVLLHWPAGAAREESEGEASEGDGAEAGGDGAGALAITDFFSRDVGSAHAVALALTGALGTDEALRDVVTGIEQRIRFLLEVGL